LRCVAEGLRLGREAADDPVAVAGVHQLHRRVCRGSATGGRTRREDAELDERVLCRIGARVTESPDWAALDVRRHGQQLVDQRVVGVVAGQRSDASRVVLLDPPVEGSQQGDAGLSAGVGRREADAATVGVHDPSGGGAGVGGYGSRARVVRVRYDAGGTGANQCRGVRLGVAQDVSRQDRSGDGKDGDDRHREDDVPQAFVALAVGRLGGRRFGRDTGRGTAGSYGGHGGLPFVGIRMYFLLEATQSGFTGVILTKN